MNASGGGRCESVQNDSEITAFISEPEVSLSQPVAPFFFAPRDVSVLHHVCCYRCKRLQVQCARSPWSNPVQRWPPSTAGTQSAVRVVGGRTVQHSPEMCKWKPGLEHSQPPRTTTPIPEPGQNRIGSMINPWMTLSDSVPGAWFELQRNCFSHQLWNSTKT